MRNKQSTPPGMRMFRLGILGTMLVAGLAACAKKTDPAAASSGGGAATQRNVLTMKGASQ